MKTPQLFLEAWDELFAAYMYASVPSWQFRKMRQALSSTSQKHPSIPLVTADELYDLWKQHINPEKDRNDIFLYTILAALLDIPQDEALEILKLIDKQVSLLQWGDYFRDTVIKTMEANKLNDK